MIDSVPIPPLVHVKQTLPTAPPVDIDATMESEWARLCLSEQVRGKRIALGFGSRGVAKIDEIARKLVALVKASGGEPFIVPAMGSHGGATPEGQIDVLAGLGITEATAGCPIEATMDVVDLGMTACGLPALIDRNVAEADGFMVVNRVKVHTDFHGKHESGLLKMMGIGLGKERGASAIHRFGVEGLRDYMPVIAKHMVQSLNFVAGFATVEDGHHQPVYLEGFDRDSLVAGEQRLLETSRDLMPRLPADNIDVLIIDEMGKDISGAGMDTNIIGRWYIAGEAEPESPRIKRIVVLDLTEASHGNATAYGLADFAVRRWFDKMDITITTKNLFTSGFLLRARMPLVFETDEEAIRSAIFDAFRRTQAFEEARVMRIKNTLEIEDVWVSPNIADELHGRPNMTVDGEAQPMVFTEGHLF